MTASTASCDSRTDLYCSRANVTHATVVGTALQLRRCSVGMAASQRAPIDGAAALAGARRVARLHDEVALHLVEEHIVVVLDPAQTTAHGATAYAAPMRTSLQPQQAVFSPQAGGARDCDGLSSVDKRPCALVVQAAEHVCQGVSKEGWEGGVRGLGCHYAWRCRHVAASALAELEEVAGREGAFFRVQIDDEVALAGLEQHRHGFLLAYLLLLQAFTRAEHIDCKQ